MRLDKYIANTTDLSRREVKLAIRKGLVEVDGSPATDSAMKVNEASRVYLDGESLMPPAPRYFMLHKPQGYVCATKDGDNPTVLELLEGEANIDKLHIAGRLDIDTTGLVLITDDGKWTHQVISPNRHCDKCYEVETEMTITPETIKFFERGIQLKGEAKRCEPAKVELLDTDHCLLTIHEGKYHQVKRMFGAMENKVTRLHRRSIGKIVLDSDLEEGEYRSLSSEEIASI